MTIREGQVRVWAPFPGLVIRATQWGDGQHGLEAWRQVRDTWLYMVLVPGDLMPKQWMQVVDDQAVPVAEPDTP